MASKRREASPPLTTALLDVAIHGWGGAFEWAPRQPGWVQAGMLTEAGYVALWHAHTEAIRAEAVRRGIDVIWVEALAAAGPR